MVYTKIITTVRTNLPAVLFSILIAVVGVYLLSASHAATHPITIEAETGSRSGAATILNDATASGSHAVRFAGSTTAQNFVSRSGSHLTLAGKQFRFAGTNLYWLGLDDNIRDGNGNPTYPTQARVNNAFAGAAQTHAAVVRAHTLGISVGCSNCIEPSLNTYNNAAFQSIDYAVQQAGKNNIKLIIPLIDQWRYYHGGKWVFVHWAYQAGAPGVSDTNSNMSLNAGNSYGSASSEKELEEQFYTNSTVINYYEDYISHVLNHVNQYTGVAMKNDPTIMAWETGNELFDAPPSWTETIAAYIKHTVGAKQLVADGSAASGNHDSNAALSAADVDIVGGHFYTYPSGLDTSWLSQDASTAAANNKVYVADEWGWSLSGSAAFMSSIETNSNIAGDLYWSMLPYEENGTPEPHASLNYGSDDVPLYVPGVSSTMNAGITALTSHATTMEQNNAQ